MKIIRRLFGQRRWLAWLPLPAAALMSGGSLGGFFDMLLGGCIWWVPYWLAYWLSDGFTTFEDRGAPHVILQGGIDPFTGKACVVIRDAQTGGPLAHWGGGQSHHHHRG